MANNNMSPEQRLWEKSTNEWRIDHPHFADVVYTTYVKGTITDFKVINTDPYEVEPLVKVQIGEDETEDYIPIFYKPKDGYWDDDKNDIDATTFDMTNEYYVMSWMSFRCGDEVVVMELRSISNPNDVKRYVIGFYDNYPRIGEDVVKRVPYSGNDVEYGRMSQRSNSQNWGFYEFNNDMGPDGKPLNLLREVESVWSNMYYWQDTYVPRYFRPRTYGGAFILVNEYGTVVRSPLYWCPHVLTQNPNGNCIWGGVECQHSDPNDREITLRYCEITMNKIGSKCSAHLCPVGPILYVAYTLWEPYWYIKGSINTNYDKVGLIMCDALYEWLHTFRVSPQEWDAPGYAFTYTEPPIHQLLQDNTVEMEDEREDECIITQVKASLYTKDLYDAVLDEKLSPEYSWTSWGQNNWSWSVDHFPYVDSRLYWQYLGDSLYYGGPLEDFFYHERDKFMVRPHTKAELQEAGLWPPDDNVEET